MSEKVNVSQGVANAIEAFKTMQKEKFNITDLDKLFDIATDWWLREEFHEFADLHVIHELKFIDFCNALYYGYEVVLTPLELVEKEYKICKANGVNDSYNRGRYSGIMYTLNMLDIKIKGINE